MVEIIFDQNKKNRNKALDTYEKIKQAILPDYSMYHSQDSFVTSYFLDDGELDCYIEKNTHKKLTFLNIKIGRLVFDGECSVCITTDDKEKVKDVAECLENFGYRVVIMIKDNWK